MNIIWSILTLLVGISAVISAFKLHAKKDNLWDNSTTLGGIVGGLFLTIVGIVTLMVPVPVQVRFKSAVPTTFPSTFAVNVISVLSGKYPYVFDASELLLAE